MRHDLVEKITDSETIPAYNQAVKELADYLRDAGEPDKAQKLTESAALRNNRFHTGKPEAFNGRFYLQIPVKGPCVIGAFLRKEEPGYERTTERNRGIY